MGFKKKKVLPSGIMDKIKAIDKDMNESELFINEKTGDIFQFRKEDVEWEQEYNQEFTGGKNEYM